MLKYEIIASFGDLTINKHLPKEHFSSEKAGKWVFTIQTELSALPSPLKPFS
jgi:hypothetical protein